MEGCRHAQGPETRPHMVSMAPSAVLPGLCKRFLIATMKQYLLRGKKPITKRLIALKHLARFPGCTCIYSGRITWGKSHLGPGKFPHQTASPLHSYHETVLIVWKEAYHKRLIIALKHLARFPGCTCIYSGRITWGKSHLGPGKFPLHLPNLVLFICKHLEKL